MEWIKWINPNPAVDHVWTWLCVVMATQTVLTIQMRSFVDLPPPCPCAHRGSFSALTESVWQPVVCVMDGWTVALLTAPMSKVICHLDFMHQYAPFTNLTVQDTLLTDYYKCAQHYCQHCFIKKWYSNEQDSVFINIYNTRYLFLFENLCQSQYSDNFVCCWVLFSVFVLCFKMQSYLSDYSSVCLWLFDWLYFCRPRLWRGVWRRGVLVCWRTLHSLPAPLWWTWWLWGPQWWEGVCVQFCWIMGFYLGYSVVKWTDMYKYALQSFFFCPA